MKIQSLTQRVDTSLVRAGSMVIPSDNGAYEIVQPQDPLFSLANFLAVAFVDCQGHCISIGDDLTEEEEDADVPSDYQAR